MKTVETYTGDAENLAAAVFKEVASKRLISVKKEIDRVAQVRWSRRRL